MIIFFNISDITSQKTYKFVIYALTNTFETQLWAT